MISSIGNICMRSVEQRRSYDIQRKYNLKSLDVNKKKEKTDTEGWLLKEQKERLT